MPGPYRTKSQKRKGPCKACAKRRAELIAARDRFVNFIKRKHK